MSFFLGTNVEMLTVLIKFKSLYMRQWNDCYLGANWQAPPKMYFMSKWCEDKRSKKFVWNLPTTQGSSHWMSPILEAVPQIFPKPFRGIPIWLHKYHPQFFATITKSLHPPGCQPLPNSSGTKPTSRIWWKLPKSTSEYLYIVYINIFSKKGACNTYYSINFSKKGTSKIYILHLLICISDLGSQVCNK